MTRKISHINEHLIYGDIDNKSREKIEKYFSKYSSCQKDKFLEYSLPKIIGVGVLIWMIGVAIFGFAGAPMFLAPIWTAIIVLGTLFPSLRVQKASKYFNDNYMYCVASSHQSNHEWSDKSGFSESWNNIYEACRIYKNSVGKLPEGVFASEVDFYATAVDVCSVFKEKNALSKVVNRFDMQNDFRELQELSGNLKQFAERCSKIVYKSNQLQQKEFISSVGESISNLNQSAEVKLAAIGELAPPSKSTPKKPIRTGPSREQVELLAKAYKKGEAMKAEFIKEGMTYGRTD